MAQLSYDSNAFNFFALVVVGLYVLVASYFTVQSFRAKPSVASEVRQSSTWRRPGALPEGPRRRRSWNPSWFW